MTRGGHIRVTLVLTVLGDRFRYAADLFCLALCGTISGAAAYYMLSLTMQSYKFGDKSPGIIALPIWVGQTPMTVGLAILTIAFADLFIRTLREGKPLPETQSLE